MKYEDYKWIGNKETAMAVSRYLSLWLPSPTIQPFSSSVNFENKAAGPVFRGHKHCVGRRLSKEMREKWKSKGSFLYIKMFPALKRQNNTNLRILHTSVSFIHIRKF